tara:strand:- start:21058 stop:21333 length:276 start_codon:yes stop_codon:yes gene_type:complete
MMSEIWRAVSMERKWKDGKGHVVLSVQPYSGKVWVDMRMHNMHREEGPTHTKQGFRLSIEQAEEMVNAMQVAIMKGKEERERNERKREESG